MKDFRSTLEHRGTCTFARTDDGREILYSYKLYENDTVEVVTAEAKLLFNLDYDLELFGDDFDDIDLAEDDPAQISDEDRAYFDALYEEALNGLEQYPF